MKSGRGVKGVSMSLGRCEGFGGLGGPFRGKGGV